MLVGSVKRKLKGLKGRKAQGRRGVTEGPRRAAMRASNTLLNCNKKIEERQDKSVIGKEHLQDRDGMMLMEQEGAS